MPSSRIRSKISTYAPKKTCSPDSTQSPSASRHDETLPPRIGRCSSSSTRYPAAADDHRAAHPALVAHCSLSPPEAPPFYGSVPPYGRMDQRAEQTDSERL